MRYLKTLLVVLLAFISVSSYAGKASGASWSGSVAAPGTYYLYNVGTGKWFCGANNWQTHASIGEYGIDVTLAGSGSQYTIDTQLSNSINNGNIGGSHFLNDVWCDGGAFNWTFTQVKTDDGAIAYTIGTGNNVLTASTTDTNLSLKAADGALSQWILVSKEDITQKVMDTKASETVDVTGYIIGQQTGRNNVRAYVRGDRVFYSNKDVWHKESDADGRWCNFNIDAPYNSNPRYWILPPAIEAWNWKSFDFYQNISNVPNGEYTLHVNGFYRGSQGVKGYVYANDAMAPLVPESEVNHGAYTGESDLQRAAAAFADGKGDNSVDVTVTNGSIRVGVKQMDAPGGDWMPFNNFRLEYKGMAPLLESDIDKAKALLPELDETNTAALTTAIAAAQKVLDNADATNGDIQAAIDALQKAYKAADALNIAKAMAIDVLTQVPANLYPKDFFWYWELDEKGNIIPKQKADNIQKMELDRKYKVYKNNAGRYSLASRLVVASLIRLMQYADADAKTRKLISTRLAELGITGFDDSSKLAELLTQYSRLVVETHGIGAALEEQGDPNYSRMYDAIAQADLDTEEFIEFLLAGGGQESVQSSMTLFYPSNGSDVDDHTWVSNDGTITVEVQPSVIDRPDPSWPSYIGLVNGDQVTISVASGMKIKGIEVDDWGDGVYNVDGQEGRYGEYTIQDKEKITVSVVKESSYYDYGVWFYLTYTDSRTPWEKAGIDYTLSDVYELLHQTLTSLVQMDNYDYAITFGTRYDYTAHILNPDLEDGAENWVITTSDPSRNPINDGQPLTASDGSQFDSYLDFWKGDGGFTFDANQTIDLPAGRYMLTVAGRASAAQLYETSLELNKKVFKGLVYAGPFTEPSAADPTNYFQLYATVSNNGVTTHQSIVPQIGANDGIFGNGWNDASVFFTMPSDGKATIGVRAGTEDKGMWISATRFRLTRLGDATLYFDENETYDTELNWDPINFFFATAPTDVVLHKNLKAGHWQSIALPVDVSAQQLVNVFGEGTELAVPSNIYIHDMENQELIVDFESWDVLAAKEGPVQTKYYNYQYYANEFGYEYPTGMIANVPYLIKPAKVSSSNLYVFHDVKSSETHGSKDFLTDDGIWSWGSFNYTFGDETTPAGFSAQVVDEDFVELFGQIEFVPNYTYIPDFTDDFAVEFSDRSKAFSAKFVCPGDWKVVAAFMDGGFEIVTDQLNDMLALGQERCEWYPGLPDAMTKAMTTSPKVESESDVYAFVKNISNGTHSDDEKSWTSADGRITLTAEGDDAYVYNYESVSTYFKHDSFNFQYLIFGPGKYTVKANNPGELIYGYQFNYMATYGDIKVTQENGEVVELPNTYYNFDPELSLSLGDNWTPELSFTVEGGEFTVPVFDFLLLYGADYTEYTDDEYFLIVDALKDAKTAISEAKKAYPAARAYHALYAEAEELLASDHVELVEGADAAFEKLLPNFDILFNRQTTTEGIVDVTERLQKAIDDFKTKVKFGGIQEGKNYLRNVATGKYLGAANNWGTQASLVKNPEFVTLAKLSDGVYTIETQVSNGGENYYLGANGFMDANPAIQVTFAPAGEYYTLTTAELGVLGYDGESNVLGKNLDAADENALWEVISEEDMLASLAEASLENPVNATFLIADPNFGRNNRYLSAWQETHDGGGGNFNFRLAATDNDDGGKGCINNASEAWLCSFDVNQEIELPNGVYVLTAQAAITDYNNVGENFPVIYAGEESSPFIVMKEEDRGTYMRQLENAFLAGEYVVNPIVVNVTDGKLKIGARGTEAQKFWAIWDNFELTAYGDADIEAVRASLATTGSGEATGIKDVNAAEGKTVIYTINGVRVNSISRPGIYIVNGKKVMVK